MVVPLKDQNGKVRYYLGAQLDITELVNSSVGLSSLQKLVARQHEVTDLHGKESLETHNDLLSQFQQLSETFTSQELQTVLKSQQRQEMDDQVVNGFDNLKGSQPQDIPASNSSADLNSNIQLPGSGSAPSLGFYKNVSGSYVYSPLQKLNIAVSSRTTPSVPSDPLRFPRFASSRDPAVATYGSNWRQSKSTRRLVPCIGSRAESDSKGSVAFPSI